MVSPRRHHVAAQPQHALGVVEHDLPAVGECDAALVADQQAHTEFVLRLGDPLRDGRLRGIEFGGGPAEAFELRDPHERRQGTEIGHGSLITAAYQK